MKNSILFLLILLIASTSYAQVGIGTKTPKATFDVQALKKDGTTPEGIIAPRLSGDELQAADNQYDLPQDGAIVYITVVPTTPSLKTKNITQIGYYSYVALNQTWEAIGSTTEPWNSTSSGLGATSNNENIYQTGAVGIGSPAIDDNAQLEISSTSKGILISRMTTEERNAITPPIADGMMIYNISTNCINYYNKAALQWVSLCGTYEPATYDLIHCNLPVGPSKQLKQGNSINDSAYYTIVVNVSKIGSYQILLTTTNGYSFNRSGIFTQTGTYTILLEGQGTPVNGPQDDAVTLYLNGIETAPSCTLPLVHVNGSTTAFSFDCASLVLHGSYFQNIPLDGTNYIEVPISTVTTEGSALIETPEINGIKFSTGSINITSAMAGANIILYGQGIPILIGGPTSYTFTPPAGTQCQANITVTSSLGTFSNPAKSCLAILEEDASKIDGEYWILDGAGGKAKTFCDMTNGGYTLIWSYSELTARTGGSIYGTANTMDIGAGTPRLSNNSPQNIVTAIAGTINYFNYRLSNTTMRNIKKATYGEYRVRITENATDMADSWGVNNYLSIKPTTAAGDFVAQTTANVYFQVSPTSGKVFGNTFTGVNNYVASYNSVNTSDVVAYVGSAFGDHWDAGNRMGNRTITVIPGGQTVNANLINNLFGYHAETEVNHLFGKCGSPGADDYSFSTTSCIATARYPHSFNGGQGRVLQWFVK